MLNSVNVLIWLRVMEPEGTLNHRNYKRRILIVVLPVLCVSSQANVSKVPM